MQVKIYVLSENLNFFYKLNKELKLNNIKFKILNFWNKIPTHSSLILTTSEEIGQIRSLNSRETNILPYKKEDNFDRYILKIMASCRLGYKDDYSELMFSIDPGIKRLGIAVFLDDYYLNSHTCYNEEELIKKIMKYSDYLQEGNSNLIMKRFKVGTGVLSTTRDLVKNIFKVFKEKNRVEVFLVNESKSSKINIYHNQKKFPKHEASALILALRNGIEINQKNHEEIFMHMKSKKKINGDYKNTILPNSNDVLVKLREIANRMLNREQSLSETSRIINDHVFNK